MLRLLGPFPAAGWISKRYRAITSNIDIRRGGSIRTSGEIFQLFRAHGDGLTKTEVVDLTGLSRTTVTQRLEALLAAGLLVSAPDGARTGGRPADRFAVNPDRGVILVAYMGATVLQAALCDPTAHVLAEQSLPSDITEGPEAVLPRVKSTFDQLLKEHGRTRADVEGLGIAVPGPVDHLNGRVVNPPIMSGWHDFNIKAWLSERFECRAIVENDVNSAAFGEQRLVSPRVDDLLYLKIGTGIGLGVIVGGDIHRGADGAAGDIGHIQIGTDGPYRSMVCRCGKIGCVETHAGGWAMLRELNDLGVDVDSVAQIIELVRQGHDHATRLVEHAVEVLGTALSDVINILNPRTLVLGGQLSSIDAILIARIREAIYRRSLPLATQRLEIKLTELAERAGVHGLGLLVADAIYSEASIEALIGQ